jgi:hypothetical protein
VCLRAVPDSQVERKVELHVCLRAVPDSQVERKVELHVCLPAVPDSQVERKSLLLLAAGEHQECFFIWGGGEDGEADPEALYKI